MDSYLTENAHAMRTISKFLLSDQTRFHAVVVESGKCLSRNFAVEQELRAGGYWNRKVSFQSRNTQ